MVTLTDRELTLRTRQGDTDAFGELVRRYQRSVFNVCYRLVGERREAEDMTQQVLLKALQSISSFKWRGIPFSAWLFRIAHNQIVDHLRKQNRNPVPLNESLASGGDNPQSIVEQKMDIEQLLSATRRLTEAQREVISLRFVGELSTAQVAKTMGRSQGAVKALQHSAIVALRKTLRVTEDE